MGFSCDDHLRRLARWLRAAGFDVAWEKEIDDAVLVRRCREEGRILLTLDRRLTRERRVEVCLLPSHDPIEQLRHAKERYDLDLLARAFTRCPVCNTSLKETKDVDVPDRVRETCDRFWSCDSCGRAYWEGDHVRHMRERFESIAP